MKKILATIGFIGILGTGLSVSAHPHGNIPPRIHGHIGIGHSIHVMPPRPHYMPMFYNTGHRIGCPMYYNYRARRCTCHRHYGFHNGIYIDLRIPVIF